jgi:sulfatase maturation enzyme AslB (radical SAM superfamily)
MTAEAIEQRIAQRRPRVHILTGAVCNDNCIFCMEEDREGRYVTNSATTTETVQWTSTGSCRRPRRSNSERGSPSS